MSNHIGDTNKMVSETPRMKAAQMAAMEHGTGDVWRVGCDIERELNAANSEVERLTKKVTALYEGAEDQNQRIQSLTEERDRANRLAEWKWNLRGEFESLLGTSDITTGIGTVKTLIQASRDNLELRKQVKEQKARIKRLAQSCAAKDEQLCNLLNICRSNGIEISSQDFINWREFP